MLPANLLSANLLICEKALTEAPDRVVSAIRIIDVFYIPAPISSPESTQTKTFFGIQVSAIVLLKAHPGDESQHDLTLHIAGPDGTSKKITSEPIKCDFKSHLHDASIPGGATAVAHLSFQTTRPGTYYLVALLDDQEIARTPLTLLLRSEEQSAD
jgi:hypothetical protein